MTAVFRVFSCLYPNINGARDKGADQRIRIHPYREHIATACPIPGFVDGEAGLG